MEIEIKVPSVGESINEVTLAKWLKKDGEIVQQDEMLCELESEKATFELNAEKSGRLKILAQESTVLKIGDVVARIDTEAEAKKEDKSEVKKASLQSKAKVEEKKIVPEPKIKAEESPKEEVRQEVSSSNDGRIIEMKSESVAPSTASALSSSREEKREKMSTLRKTVSRRLVAAKNQTAMLTTFNEVDMTAIIDIRQQYKEIYKDQDVVKLGFMSFFTRAVCIALKEFPKVNASIDEEEIVYHNYCYISIAVSTPKGLVVPVIRDAETLSMTEIETKVADLAARGRDNKLTMEEMTGGTFTITNGGVFGSLMSTPIINIPQTAILGLHKIQDRPVALNGKVVIRPMMYLALSYDHRLIDGKESVTFLVRVKELLESPYQFFSVNETGSNS